MNLPFFVNVLGICCAEEGLVAGWVTIKTNPGENIEHS